MQFTYLRGWNRGKDDILAAIAAAGTSAKRLPLIGLSAKGFPETKSRTDAAFEVAKHQPTSRLTRFAKRRLIQGQYNWARRYFSDNPDHIAMCWNGITGSRKAFMDAAADAGAKRLFVERAPFPDRITLDPNGVNYAGSLPRDSAAYLRWAETAGHSSDQWRAIGETLTARASRRADVGQGSTTGAQGNYLFVPLQVPNDSQVTRFGGWIENLPDMIKQLGTAAMALPEGWHIRCKEHPSAKEPLTKELAVAAWATQGKLIIDNQSDTFAQVAGSQGVVTLNSSVGLQAFFYDKPVITLGQAFFGLPGLVHPANNIADLTALFSTPETLSFDQSLRDAFMTYLDQVYYPRLQTTPDGRVQIDPDVVRAKLSARSPL